MLHINDFKIDYQDNGQVDQFYSDVSMLDLYGNEVYQKKIFVNEPMRYKGVTVYQTDWGMVSLVLTANGCPFIQPDQPVSVLLASLEGKSSFSGRAWGTFIPTSTTNDNKLGISMVLRDFLSVTFYDDKGRFVGVRSVKSKKPIFVEGIEFVILEAVGGTGLQLKADPAVTIVYTGFGLVLITSFLSCISLSQVWALQEGSSLLVGGDCNRSSSDFASELQCITTNMPRYITTAER